MDFSRTGVEIGPFDILGVTLNPTLHFYGLLIVTGIVLGASISAWLVKRDGKDPDHVWNGLIWAVVGGVIGARLWFVFFPSKTLVAAGKDTGWMLSHPFDLNDGPLAIWNGGLGIYGAVIGGLIGILFFARRAKLAHLPYWIDIGVVGLPLGQALGRWGNYVNQELYGKPTDLPWAINIDNPPPEYADVSGFHPLFLYESLWNIFLCGILLWIWLKHRDKLVPGDLFLMYLIGYPVVRFLLEFIRLETAYVPGLGVNSSQLASVLAILVAGGMLYYRHKVQAAPTYAKLPDDGTPPKKNTPKEETRQPRKRRRRAG